MYPTDWHTVHNICWVKFHRFQYTLLFIYMTCLVSLQLVYVFLSEWNGQNWRPAATEKFHLHHSSGPPPVDLFTISSSNSITTEHFAIFYPLAVMEQLIKIIVTLLLLTSCVPSSTLVIAINEKSPFRSPLASMDTWPAIPMNHE